MLNDLTITLAAVGMRHAPGFRVVRPAGAGEYVFLHFLTPTFAMLDERACHMLAGTCLIFSPATPQWYGCDGVGLANDWFHFRGASGAELMRAHGIPLDTPFLLAPGESPAALIGELVGEATRREPGWERAQRLHFAQLALWLQRKRMTADPGATEQGLRALREQFRALRTRMLEEYSRQWSVPELAREVHLSRSRFTSLYRSFFGTSPHADLIEERLRRARVLLTNTGLPVGQIAASCGFGSLYYFSRLFHARVGCAPRDYYGRVVAGQTHD